jgi:hypothetical protein
MCDGKVTMASGSCLSRRSRQHPPRQFLLLDGSAAAHGACEVDFPDGYGRNLLELADITFVGTGHRLTGSMSSFTLC